MDDVLLADLRLEGGRDLEAWVRHASATEDILAASEGEPSQRLLINALTTFALSVRSKHPMMSARAMGAVDAMYVLTGTASDEVIIDWQQELLAPAIWEVSLESWAAALEQGRGEDPVALMRLMAALPLPEEHSTKTNATESSRSRGG